MSLDEMTVLLLDCQATGANPVKGDLLEIAWVKCCAGEDLAALGHRIESQMVRLPQDAKIPRQVARLTGIDQAMVDKKGLDPEEIWRRLTNTARETVEEKMPLAIVIIHYARYEAAFLKALHLRCDPAQAFPFQIICSHRIAQKALPGLPRKGIRAVAGYYGHLCSQKRRSMDHVMATAVIWKHLVEELSTRFEIHTLGDLSTWLERKPEVEPVKTKRRFPMRAACRQHLPRGPGIYRMLNQQGDLLYVGKAKSIRSRVGSYFQPSRRLSEHILEMLSQARDLSVERTQTALEAALLEADEIKHKTPLYNLALRIDPGRKICYISKDGEGVTFRPETGAWMGPFPSQDLPQRLVAMNKLLRHPEDMLPRLYSMEGLMAADPRYLPDEDNLRAGIDIFRSKYAQSLECGTFLRFATALGAALWRKKLVELESLAQAHAAKDLAEASDGSRSPDEQALDEHLTEAGIFTWSPETALGWLEGIIRHGAHMLRRARWLRLLSNAALVFQSWERENRIWRHLVIKKGRIVGRKTIPNIAASPDPAKIPGNTYPPEAFFDLETYDRLRVLTTEIRRLVAEERVVRLRIGSRPKAVLDEERLRRLMRWV
jgi:DNA polymerase-3 subunit epsilon